MPSLPRRALASLPLGLAAGLAAPALAQPRGTLRFVPQSDLAVLDPVWSTTYVTRAHGLMVFDTLYGLDAEYRLQPQMAEGHAVEEDGRRWTIRLREGLRFHDGAPVRAADCIASIRRWAVRDGLGQSLMAVVEEMAAADDRTLRIRLRRPFPLLAYALGKPGTPVCFIMPERLAATDPFRQVTEMVGSGPFRFLANERVAGARLAYARNPDYVPRPGGAPGLLAGPKQVNVERVEWHVLPDPSTAAAALRAGEVDWWENPGFDLLPLLARDRRLTVAMTDPGGFTGCLRFNHQAPPFDDPALRRAVLPALSQADYMQAVAGALPDGWRDGTGFFGPASPMATTAGMEALTGPRDLAAARRAVQAAGYRGERVVMLAPADFPTLKALGDVGADLFQKLGFRVDYQPSDWGTMQQRLSKMEGGEAGGWNLFHTFWAGIDQQDPAVHLWLRGNGRAARTGWPESPRLEALREEWLQAPDEPAQKRIAEAMQRQAFEDVPYVPLGQILPRTAWRREVTEVVGGGIPVFWGLRLSSR